MAESSTPSTQTLQNLVRAALKNGNWGAPSARILDFIRNYSISSRV